MVPFMSLLLLQYNLSFCQAWSLPAGNTPMISGVVCISLPPQMSCLVRFLSTHPSLFLLLYPSYLLPIRFFPLSLLCSPHPFLTGFCLKKSLYLSLLHLLFWRVSFSEIPDNNGFYRPSELISLHSPRDSLSRSPAHPPLPTTKP